MKQGLSALRPIGIVLLLAALTATLAACSGIPRQQRDQEQLERYLQYSGPPVDRITYLGHYYGWQSLSQTQLVVWTTPNDAYLLTVVPPCTDLPFVQRIGLTSTARTVSVRFDSVLVRHWRCQISEIRPIDYSRMRKDMRARHDQEKAMPPHNGDEQGNGGSPQDNNPQADDNPRDNSPRDHHSRMELS
ncbi:MAG TPA: DUF6491 family protein [Steroidobacteraceae bacterium]|nr:DUF6491 family protein [Steroidobacteraceae bacterium]